MEYDDENNGAAGSIPEFGAIFMSNTMTKKECLERKIFALPSSQAEFVKHVKAGMILFLFEADKRQLFGVYQASSDGAMNIVPHAFNYSGKHFPAQVRFTPIWYCDPLSEKDFQDAIRENYFSPKKFKFGLSEDQVRRLLSLFSSRKLRNKMPPHLLAGRVAGEAVRDRGLVDDDRFALNERGYVEPDEYDEFYRVNRFSRAKEDEVLIADGVNNEDKVYHFGRGEFLAKRRRIDNDDRLVTNDIAENRIYNHGTLRNFHIDSPKDSLGEVRRLADARRLLTIEGVRNENRVDRILSPVLSSVYLMDSLDVGTADDGRFMQRNRLFNEYNVDYGSGKAFASEHYGKRLDKSKHAIDDDMLLFDDCSRREHNVRDTIKPMVHGDDNLNLHRQAREVIDDHQYLIDRKLENRYNLECDGSPIRFEHSASLLHKIRETTGAGRFPINDRIENESNFGTSSLEGLSYENISHLLHSSHRIIYDRKYPIVEGRVTEYMMDGVRCSAASTRNPRYISSVDGRVVDDGRFRKSERVDNEEDMHTFISPVVSMEYPSLSNRKQNLSSFPDKSLQEKVPSQLTVAHNFDPLRSTFDDATITRAVPYIPECPNFSHGCSASVAANRNSSLVQESHPHHGSLGNFDSLSKKWLSPQLKKSSRSQDITLEFGNKGLPTNISSYQSSLLHETPSSFLDSKLSMHVDLNTSAPVNYGGSFSPKLSSTSLPSTDCENIEVKKGFLFAHPSKSSVDRFSFDENLPARSQHVSEHVPQQEMDLLAGKDFNGVRYPGRDLASDENQYFRISSNMHLKEQCKVSEAPHFDSTVKRRSVFTRLTSRQESQVGEERNDSDLNCHDYYMDATADDIMEMLPQRNNLSLRKLRKSRVVGQLKHGESAVDEKRIQNHKEINNSATEKKKMTDACLAIPEIIDEVPKETRNVDFRRRSETKRKLVGTRTDSTADNKVTGVSEEVGSSMKKALKRKKLVRPVFWEIGSATEAICSNQNLSLLGDDKDDKQQTCERAISIHEAEISNDNTKLSNVVASHIHQSVGYNTKEHSNPEVQKDTGVHVLPPMGHELKGHNQSNLGLQRGYSQVLLKETTQDESLGVQTSVEGISSKDNDATVSILNLEETSSEGFKLGASRGNIHTEEKNSSMLRGKRKIIKTNKRVMEPSKWQPC